MISIEVFDEFIKSITPLSWNNVFTKLKSIQSSITQEMEKYTQLSKTKNGYEYSNQFKGDIFEYLTKYLLMKNGYTCWLYNDNESTEIKLKPKFPKEFIA